MSQGDFVTIEPSDANGLQKPSQLMVDMAMPVKRDKLGAAFGMREQLLFLGHAAGHHRSQAQTASSSTGLACSAPSRWGASIAGVKPCAAMCAGSGRPRTSAAQASPMAAEVWMP